MSDTTNRRASSYRIGSTPTTIICTGLDGQTIVVAVTQTLGATHSYGQMCADARFIVKACTAHEQLVAALHTARVVLAGPATDAGRMAQALHVVMDALAAEGAA